MDCREAEYLLHGYVDGELELAGSYEFERHLAGCATCAAKLAREQSLRARLAGSAGSFRSPPHLKSKIESALAEVIPAADIRSRASQRHAHRLLTAVVAAGLCGVALMILFRPDATDALLVRQVRDSHVRSLMAAHLYDVESSDQHTVKPWFAGRLDFAPWVSNLADEGFRLVGGRLEYFDNRAVAALVFRRRDHVINLLTWPAPNGATTSPQLDRLEGYQIVHWSAGGMTYWAVSDLNAAELQDFATLVQSRANFPDANRAAPAEQSPANTSASPDRR